MPNLCQHLFSTSLICAEGGGAADRSYLRDIPQDQIVCFFEHCSKGGGVKPMFKKFSCKFGIILEAIWQYKLT